MSVQKVTYQGCILPPSSGFGGLAVGGVGIQPFVTNPDGGLAMGGAHVDPFIAIRDGGLAMGGSSISWVIAPLGGLAMGGSSVSPEYPAARGGLAMGGAAIQPSTPTTLYYQVTQAGITNGACSDCALMNTTLTCSMVTATVYETIVPLCGGISPQTVQINLASPAGTLRVGWGTYQWSVSTAGWDFFSPIVVGSGMGLNPYCNNMPATVTVNGIML